MEQEQDQSPVLLAKERSIGIDPLRRKSVYFAGNSSLIFPSGRSLCVYEWSQDAMHFIDQNNEISVFTLSTDSSKVAIGSTDSISIFDTESGNCENVIKLDGELGTPESMSFSSDNKMIAAQFRNEKKSIIYWKCDNGKLLCEAKSPKQATHISICPADPFVVCATGPALLRTWKVNKDTELKCTTLLTTNMELEDSFLDHAWLENGMCAILTQSSKVLIMGLASPEAAKAQKYSIMQTLKLTYPKELEGCEPIAIVSSPKGFVVTGSHGTLSVFELDTEQSLSFSFVKTFSSTLHDPFTSATVSPLGETIVCVQGNNLISFPLGKLETLEENSTTNFRELPFKMHNAPIKSMDLSFGNTPYIVTIDSEKYIRIVNAATSACLVDDTLGPTFGSPLSVAINATATLLAIGCQTELHIVDILHDRLNERGTIPLRRCHDVCFSHGGQYLACASNNAIYLYSMMRGALVRTFEEHTGAVRLVSFSADDATLLSAGADGLTVARRISDRRQIEGISTLTHSSTSAFVTNGVCDTIAVASLDGNLREIHKGNMTFSTARKSDRGDVANDAPNDLICSMVLVENESLMFAGMSSGMIRAYRWPISAHGGAYTEFPIHVGAVNYLSLSGDSQLLVSSNNSGVVMVHKPQFFVEGEWKPCSPPHQAAWDVKVIKYSMLKSDWENILARIQELEATNSETVSNTNFLLHSKDTEWTEQLRVARAETSAVLDREQKRYEDLRVEFERFRILKANELMKTEDRYNESALALERVNSTAMAAAQAKYEEKCEEIEKLRQKTDDILLEQERMHLQELDSLKQALEEERKLRKKDINSLQEELLLEQRRGAEIIAQIEQEYELEIQSLERNKKTDMDNERKISSKKEVMLLQERHKLDRMQTHVQAVESSKETDQHKIHVLETKIQGLEATITRYEHQLNERQLAFTEQEKQILHLRSNNKTLENFRYVLDSEIKQLHKEKGPMSSHIEKLEKHIKAMYSELVNEFAEKKSNELQSTHVSMKLETTTRELASMRDRLRERESEIDTISHALSRCYALVDPVACQHQVQTIYKKLVMKDKSFKQKPTSGIDKNRTVAEVAANQRSMEVGFLGSEADDVLEENNRQRDFMRKAVSHMRDAMEDSKKKYEVKSRRHVSESSSMISESNRLRKESLENKLKADAMERKAKKLAEELSRIKSENQANESEKGAGKRSPKHSSGLIKADHRLMNALEMVDAKDITKNHSVEQLKSMVGSLQAALEERQKEIVMQRAEISKLRMDPKSSNIILNPMEP